MRSIAAPLLLVVPLILFHTTTLADEKKPLRPNIVFLLADDLGWTGLKCFGSDLYETPHLDRLAADGVKFTNAYAACTVCSPTRASIMTGMYPARMRLTDFIAGQNRPWAKMRIPDWTKKLELRHATLPQRLKSFGYRTVHIGKWHLSPRSGGSEYQPKARGFDQQVLKPAKSRGYFLPPNSNKRGESQSNYLTDYLTDKALEAIDQVKDDPFFLYFAYHTPHTPIQGRPDLVERFRGRLRPNLVHNNPTYAAMVSSLDQSVGRIRQRLIKHGIDDRTLIVFTSDNGGLTQRYGKHDGFTENLPLRRGKGSAYEGGVRVPTIIQWTGVTGKGVVCDQPIISTDFYPTFTELAGAKDNKNAKHPPADGVSIVPLIRNPQTKMARDLFWHYPHYHAGGDGPYGAIRSGDWRLVEFYEDQRLELFNLKSDPGETANLARSNSDQARKLYKRLKDWRKSIDAQMPTANPDYDPKKQTVVSRAKKRTPK